MSTLPDCDLLSGYLPPGLHPATHDELRRRFATGDPRSTTWGSPQRSTLFSGYERLVAALQATELPAEQWIGGSFISQTTEPRDIDLVNYCDARHYEALAPEMKALIKQYFLGTKTAGHCHCDSYFAIQPPEGHQNNADFKVIADYWRNKLGHDKVGRPKGIVARRVEIEQETIDEKESIDAIAT